MPIELNPLECARFGIVAAQVTDSRASIDVIDAAAAAHGVQLLSCRLDVGDLSRVHALEAADYRLMDTLVYYGRPLTNLPPLRPLPAGVTWCPATQSDSVAVGEIARLAFSNYIGHYHSDPRLENVDADAAYVEWAETSTARSTAKEPVLLAKLDERVIGFVILRRNNHEDAEMVLGGFHPEFQGQGFYVDLVTKALNAVQVLGATRMVVSTQINNYAVQRIWARHGFAHERSVYTFHKWF